MESGPSVVVTIVGCCWAGKTSLFFRLAENRFPEKLGRWDSYGHQVKTLQYENVATVIIHDISQEPRIEETVEPLYCLPKGQIIILCFDLTVKTTFDYLEYEVQRIHKVVGEDVEILLVGCKSDLPNQEVTEEMGQELALKLGLFYLHSSALKDDQAIFKSKLEEVVRKYLYSKDLKKKDVDELPHQYLVQN